MQAAKLRRGGVTRQPLSLGREKATGNEARIAALQKQEQMEEDASPEGTQAMSKSQETEAKMTARAAGATWKRTTESGETATPWIESQRTAVGMKRQQAAKV